MKKSTKLTLEMIGLEILGIVLGIISGFGICRNVYKNTEPIDMTPIPVTEASVLPTPPHDPDPGDCLVGIPEEPAEKTVIWENDILSDNVINLSATNGTVYVSNPSQTYTTMVCQFSGDVKFDSFESIMELCKTAYIIETVAPGESRKIKFDSFFSNTDIYTTMIIENFNEDPAQPELAGNESLAARITYSFN